MKKQKESRLLTTGFEPKDPRDIPFSDYPRPALRRDSYFCLNGTWKFSVEKEAETLYSGKITVPFPPESRLSGVERITAPEETLVYQRAFSLPAGFIRGRVILHVGAADQKAAVFLNGSPLGSHEGGYLPFSFDITPYLKEENTLIVRIKDDLDHALPYGKQTLAPGGMWYTGVSGIWQTVWLESVPEDAIEGIRVETKRDCARITVTGGKSRKRLLLQEEGAAREFVFAGESLTIRFPSPHNWSPEDPFLYRFTLVSGRIGWNPTLLCAPLPARHGRIRPFSVSTASPIIFTGFWIRVIFPTVFSSPALWRATARIFSPPRLAASICSAST